MNPDHQMSAEECKARHHDYPLAFLQELPTINQGHFDNLKIEHPTTRVWLSRCGVADGLPHDNMVTVETLQRGSWKEYRTYQAR